MGEEYDAHFLASAILLALDLDFLDEVWGTLGEVNAFRKEGVETFRDERGALYVKGKVEGIV